MYNCKIIKVSLSLSEKAPESIKRYFVQGLNKNDNPEEAFEKNLIQENIFNFSALYYKNIIITFRYKDDGNFCKWFDYFSCYFKDGNIEIILK